MEIKIEDYLTSVEMKEIVREHFSKAIKADAERILGNFAYYAGHGFIDEILTPVEKGRVKTKVHEILKNHDIISRQVFRSRNAWDNKRPNEIEDIISSAITQNADIIRDGVIKAMEKLANDEEKMEDFIINGGFEKIIKTLIIGIGGVGKGE